MIGLLKDFKDLAWQLVPRPFFCPSYFFSPDDLSIFSTSNSDSFSLDILTYNVENTSYLSEIRSKNIVEAIFKSDADIICLQETNPGWEQLLEFNLSFDFTTLYPYRYFHHPTNRPAGGSAFLSKIPIIDIDIVDSSETIEGSVFATLVGTFDVDRHKESTTKRKKNRIKIANVHLRPPVELDGSAYLSTARVTGLIRKSEIKEIMSKHSDTNMIVGDFNENDYCCAIRTICTVISENNQQIYEDALHRFVPFYKETHRWPFYKMTLFKRLDHILYRKGSQWICDGCGVISGYEELASDHQPVLARFSYVKRKEG